MKNISVLIFLAGLVIANIQGNLGISVDEVDIDIAENTFEFAEGSVSSEELDPPVRKNRKDKAENKRGRQVTKNCYADSSNETTQGYCTHKTTCIKEQGTVGVTCGARGQVCCSMEKSCSSASKSNNTNFVNHGYPKPDSGTGACSLTLNRINDNICQMRFDFITLELSQPDSEGNCVTDFLTVTGGTTDAPIICGSNTGQHMYVDVDPEGGAVRLTVDRTAASMSERMWSVMVTQVECTSKFKAPAGCLQYFTETSGTVSSFNFNQKIDTEVIPQTTRQIVNMDYAVCVKMADGYCSIMWTRNTTGGDHAFTVSANVAGISDALIGDPASSSTANRCTTDYVVIPGAVDDIGVQNDRFCGTGFPNWVTSSFRPFIMFITTDGDEQKDVHNRGFSLDYRQTIC